MVRGILFSVIALIPIAATACASAAAIDPANAVTLRVENNIVPSTPAVVFAEDETGSRRRIGFVSGGRTADLTFAARSGQSTYRFIAEVEGAPPAATSTGSPSVRGNRDAAADVPSSTATEIASPTIDLGPADGAVWNLANNIVVPM